MTAPSRAFAIVLLAVVAAFACVLTPPKAADVEAASTKLTLVTDSRYDVQPASHRVHVTVDITAANHTSETRIRRYFFDHANLAVLPDATGMKVTSSGAKPTVRVAARPKGYAVLSIGFGRKLYSGRSMALRLTFDLKDSGGGAAATVRVTDNLATFPVWAFASDGASGSSVRVVFPAGYSIQEATGSMGKPQAGPNGTQVFSAGPLSSPLGFSAYFIADRPGAFRETPLDLTVGGQPLHVVVRAWADDPRWGKRMGALVRSALPALGTAIGLPYQGEGPLIVEEAIGRTRGAPLGQFDPADGRVRVAYYGDSYTVLRELALAWFNGNLLADRWADESFASWYAVGAAKTMGVKVAPPALTAGLEKAKLPLNSWRPSGRADDAASAYALAAGLTLARAIAGRAGSDGLRAVWVAAAAREPAYQPIGTPTGGTGPAPGAPDWRGLLDLLETRTSQDYDDLWRKWVSRSVRAHGLAVSPSLEYGSARNVWLFVNGRAIRDRSLTHAVLRAYGELMPHGRYPGAIVFLEVPPSELDVNVHPTKAEVRLADARAAMPAEADVPTWLGLFGTRPDALLARSSAAFSRGDLPAAVQSAQDAKAIWQAAPDTGRRRLTAMVLSALIVFAIVLLLTRSRAGSRGRRATRQQKA